MDEYGWTSSSQPESCDYLAPQIIKILRELAVRRICDIGAGNGSLAASLDAAGFYAAGVEPDSRGVEICRRNCPSTNFYNLGVEDDPSIVLLGEKGPFDAVVSTEVVEHLFSPHLLPAFARQVLRQHGYMVLSTPYHGYFKNAAISILGKWDGHHDPLWAGGHIKFWSRRTLTKLLETNGFTVIGFRGVGRLPWLWKSMILVAKMSGS